MTRPTTKHTAAEDRAAVIGILSRPGEIDDKADEICAVFDRSAKRAAAGTVPKCHNPAGPHPMTALVGTRCPICQWSPYDTPTTTGT